MWLGDYIADEDYEIVEQMWNNQGSACPPKGVLGDKGVICKEDGVGICAIFIFQPSSEMGMLEFMIANIKVDRKIRSQAIDSMLEKSVAICNELGYKYIYTASSDKKFIKRLECNNFCKSGTPQQHMFWGL